MTNGLSIAAVGYGTRVARKLGVYLADTKVWVERLLDQEGSEGG